MRYGKQTGTERKIKAQQTRIEIKNFNKTNKTDVRLFTYLEKWLDRESYLCLIHKEFHAEMCWQLIIPGLAFYINESSTNSASPTHLWKTHTTKHDQHELN